jgi:aldehyde dehydrogenase (NAD+)
MAADRKTTPSNPFTGIHETQVQAFRRGGTMSRGRREAALRSLYRGVRKHEKALLHALKKDLNKSAFEGFSNEIGMVYAEITCALKHLKKWMRPKRVVPDLHLMPASARVIREPYGVSLILAPWNYPVQLLLTPLVGALAGGNTAILKPSEVSVASARALTGLIRDTFDPDTVAVVNGGPEVSRALLELPVDHIFFTGSVAVGRIVMQAASARLTPVTLELGGKSPAVVTKDADVQVSAGRIAWGKFNNAGQTCVAPDYVMVQEDRFDELVRELVRTVRMFYGENPRKSGAYGRIINEAHFDRLRALMPAGKGGPLLCGGETDRDALYIAPCVYGPVQDEDPLMADEIFGPLLPVQTYRTEEEAVRRILDRPKPLALYVFTKNKKSEKAFTTRIPFGGGGVNTTVLHVASTRLPFGGVGPSGLGRYHGRASFEAFTHPKSLLKQPLRPDLGLAYPHKALKMSWVRRLLK